MCFRFEVAGYGCVTCVGNTTPLPESVVDAIKQVRRFNLISVSLPLSDLLCIYRSACVQGDLVACGVLSGNRHLEGRLCDCVRANYLASPPLVVAYAIAGTVSINLETEPLGVNSEGKDVYLRDVWPSKEEVNHTEENIVIASMFKELRSRMEVRDYNSTLCYYSICCSSENMKVLVIWIDWFTESVVC